MDHTDATAATEDPATVAVAAAPGPPPRARGDHAGIPVRLGDGRTWSIPLCRRGDALKAERDAIANAAWGGPRVTMGTILGAALYLLSIVYDEPTESIAQAVAGADPAELGPAVQEALLIPNIDDDRTIARSYSDWLAGGLAANGLAAAKIPDDVLAHVVKHLVDTGRMARPERFISVAVGMRIRSEVLNMVAGD